MRRAWTPLLFLAWIMLQVPLLFCANACAQSVRPALLAQAHACHDTRSVKHVERCHDGHEDEGPCSHPEDEEGAHVLLHLLAQAADAQVLLPPPTGCVFAATPHDAEPGRTGPAWDLALLCGSAEDLPPSDPVRAFDRLQV